MKLPRSPNVKKFLFKFLDSNHQQNLNGCSKSRNHTFLKFDQIRPQRFELSCRQPNRQRQKQYPLSTQCAMLQSCSCRWTPATQPTNNMRNVLAEISPTFNKFNKLIAYNIYVIRHVMSSALNLSSSSSSSSSSSWLCNASITGKNVYVQYKYQGILFE